MVFMSSDVDAPYTHVLACAFYLVRLRLSRSSIYNDRCAGCSSRQQLKLRSPKAPTRQASIPSVSLLVCSHGRGTLAVLVGVIGGVDWVPWGTGLGLIVQEDIYRSSFSFIMY